MDHYNDDFGGRSRWLRFGALGLSAVVLLATGFGIGRLSAPASGSGQQRATVSGQNGPGPTRVENGVPVGYAHTPEGAVAAATNFVMVVNGPLNVQPEQYRAAISTLVSPGARGTLQSDGQNQQQAFQRVFGLLTGAQQGRADFFRTVPLTYHLDKYDSVHAQVSIWAETIVAVDGSYAPHVSWATGTCTVEWVAGDWKLPAVASYPNAPDGPVPVTGQLPAQTGPLPVQLKEGVNCPGFDGDSIPLGIEGVECPHRTRASTPASSDTRPSCANAPSGWYARRPPRVARASA
jgi:hypothetical protein